MKKLIEFTPNYLKDNKTINAIYDAIQPIFDSLEKEAIDTRNNIVPQTANSKGLEAFEEWLGIKTNKRLSLKDREVEVLAKLNQVIPYTEVRLLKMLAGVVGWDKFELEIDFATVRVTVDTENIRQTLSVKRMLEAVLPLNLHFDITHILDTGEESINLASTGVHTKISKIKYVEKPTNFNIGTAGVFTKVLKVQSEITPTILKFTSVGQVIHSFKTC